MNAHTISTERLLLQDWLDSDLQPFIEMNKDAEVMKFFPKTLSDHESLELLKRIRLHYDKHNFGLFAVEDKAAKKFIGFTGFAIPSFHSFFTPCIEIGWRYKRESWGRGFATEAAAACLQYGFTQLGFDKIVSFTSILNVKSENVMKRIGMRKVANFNHPNIEEDNILCNHVLYEITKGEFWGKEKDGLQGSAAQQGNA